MAGQSEQEKETKRQLAQQREFQSDVSGGKYNVANPFTNYQYDFDYQDVSKNLDDIFGGYEEMINRDTAETIAQQQGNAASSLASRGITGGSILTDTQSGIATDINKSKANALSNLGIGKAQQTANLQDLFNRLGISTTQAGVNVDFGNMRNVLSSLLSSMGAQQGLAGGLSGSTWLDDLFAGVGTAAQIGSIPLSGGTTVLGKILD